MRLFPLLFAALLPLACQTSSGGRASVQGAPAVAPSRLPKIEPAARPRGESAKTTHARWLETSGGLELTSDTARDMAVGATVVQPNAVVWTAAQLQKGFETLRDATTSGDPDMPNVPRRLTWLYPDDGCFARSAYGAHILEAAGYPVPSTVFTFGDLQVSTSNHPNGIVTWSYHVAPVVSVNGATYVLDPALEPKKPLTLAQWIAVQGDPQVIDVAFCDRGAMDPNMPCFGGGDTTAAAMSFLQALYFRYEWDRQIDLGREPSVVLGASPPWAL